MEVRRSRKPLTIAAQPELIVAPIPVARRRIGHLEAVAGYPGVREIQITIMRTVDQAHIHIEHSRQDVSIARRPFDET